MLPVAKMPEIRGEIGFEYVRGKVHAFLLSIQTE
jgi:hypothetical protein